MFKSKQAVCKDHPCALITQDIGTCQEICSECALVVGVYFTDIRTPEKGRFGAFVPQSITRNKHLARLIEKLLTFCDLLQLCESTAQDAKYRLNQLFEAKRMNESTEDIELMAVIYITTVQTNCPRTFLEFGRVFGVGSSALSAKVTLVRKTIDITLVSFEAVDFVFRWCGILGIDRKPAALALRIVRSLGGNLEIDFAPKAAAAILTACYKYQLEVQLSNVCDVSGVSKPVLLRTTAIVDEQVGVLVIGKGFDVYRKPPKQKPRVYLALKPAQFGRLSARFSRICDGKQSICLCDNKSKEFGGVFPTLYLLGARKVIEKQDLRSKMTEKDINRLVQLSLIHFHSNVVNL